MSEGSVGVVLPKGDAPIKKESIVLEAASQSSKMSGGPVEVALPKGVAPIKKEFLVLEAGSRVINWDHLPEGEQNRDKNEDRGDKRPRVDDRDLPDGQKKFKLRGQNKNKLRYKICRKNGHMRGNKGDRDGDENNYMPRDKFDRSSKLCLKVCDINGCPYGTKCEYSHDAYKIHKLYEKEIFDDKPCYIYSSYGKCNFGVACLYSKNHIHVNDDLKQAFNLIDHKRWSCGGREDFIERSKNKLETSIQIKLRKKAYNFDEITEIANKLAKADTADNDQVNDQNEKRIGAAVVDEHVQSRGFTKKKVDFKGKLYLAPLTTVGNLPFRRLCKKFSCDITCAEMSLCTSLLNGNPSEWSHLRRHESEDVFGAQITASQPEHAAKVVKVLNDFCDIDFIDFNCGCPTELIYQMGAGSGLMQRGSKLRKMLAGACMLSKVPITVKMRSGCTNDKNIAHNLIRSIVTPFTSKHIGAITVHGRSRVQRYTKLADWEYTNQCGAISGDIPLIGSGDCISWQEYYQRLEEYKNVSGVMIARGALISPWLFTEIKERRTWDISSRERLDIIRDYTNFALDHWGSDAMGIENCRRYLLEWLSFSCRYIPVGLLEVIPQKINERPPKYKGRDELETLLSSPAASDWVKISEMFLGKVPDNFKFLPKHKANAYDSVVDSVEG
uniref:tRNA-dihydrouridine(47) synthase [NAD(P)(+)] n=1 Tax=Aceria tosichella TaxID=561515 RepID=A0A6G1S6B1_9ACAR